jgi:hypothetical protein
MGIGLDVVECSGESGPSVDDDLVSSAASDAATADPAASGSVRLSLASLIISKKPFFFCCRCRLKRRRKEQY